MRAIVLSGGGAKGAYQLGAWKALKKLHIHYDIVTGTSIGAMNGLLVAQKEYKKCYNLWNNIDFSQIFDDFDSTNIYKSYLNHALKGGIKTDKIQALINKYYNPQKLYRRNIKYGVVTLNLTTKKPVLATTLNTSPDKLKEYIMASATCFPVFEVKKIDGEEYVDGGYYDNLPVNLAFDLGADEVIAINLEALGLKRRIKNKNKKIIEISPNNKIESFLMFEKNAANRMIQLGYNDTMKKFNKLEGKKYTFKKGALYYNYKKYKNNFIKNIDFFVEKPVGTMKKILDDKDLNLIMSKLVEDVLELFEIDETIIYNSTLFNKKILKAFEQIKVQKIDSIEELKLIVNRKVHIRNIYEKIKKGEKISYAICNIFHTEVIIAIYLYTIQEG